MNPPMNRYVSGMLGAELRLGIDFGTSSTVAVLARADGRVAPVLFGETPLLASAVCLDPATPCMPADRAPSCSNPTRSGVSTRVPCCSATAVSRSAT
jgi:hypothetical protein